MPTWRPNFAFHLPVPWGRVDVNIHQLVYAYEADARTVWDDGKCEAYAQTGRMLFDRRGRVATLVARGAAGRFVPAPKWRLLALRRHGLLDGETVRAIEEAMACDPRSSVDLERRIAALTRSWEVVRASAPELDGDLYRIFTAGQLQLRERTSADTVRVCSGEEAYDQVNALLTDADPAPN